MIGGHGRVSVRVDELLCYSNRKLVHHAMSRGFPRSSQARLTSGIKEREIRFSVHLVYGNVVR
jgi:hypothetical protein